MFFTITCIVVLVMLVTIRTLAAKAITSQKLESAAARAAADDAHAALAGQPHGMPEPEERCEVVADSDAREPYACGHQGLVAFHANLWGTHVAPTKFALSQREKCPDCMFTHLRPALIRCALCGHAIMPGQPVALCSGGKLREEIATRTPDGSFICCMRRECCPSGGFFAGFWDGKRFVSASDQDLTVVEVHTGKPDIGNPKDG